MMVEYFESYESVTNKILDWEYAARMVMWFNSFTNPKERRSPSTMVSSSEGRPGYWWRTSDCTLLRIGPTSLTKHSSHTVWMPSAQSPCGVGVRRSSYPTTTNLRRGCKEVEVGNGTPSSFPLSGTARLPIPEIGSEGITSFFWHQLRRDSVLKASTQYGTNASWATSTQSWEVYSRSFFTSTWVPRKN